MSTLHILVSRHSAFYSPLICAISRGFLKTEGFEATYGVLGPGETSREALRSGRAQLVQSAVSSNWGPREKGITGLPVHIAQINCRDGFFILGRKPGQFAWKNLERASLLADHAGQPLAMLRYAAFVNAVDWNAVQRIDRGSPEQMFEAFRAGEADFVHLQSPAAHELEASGDAHILVSVGASMPEVAFSTICAPADFADSEQGHAFLRAFAEAKSWVRSAPAHDVAEIEAGYFPGISRTALERSIAAYQQLGCWRGGTEIPRAHYEQALTVFEHSKAIRSRHPYEEVVR